MRSRSPASVLVAGFTGPIAKRIASGLQDASFEVRSEPWSDSVLLLVESQFYDVIVAGPPLSGIDFGMLLSSVRAKASACCRSGLVILVAPDDVEPVERFVGRGVNRVLPDTVTSQELVAAVNDVRDVAPRYQVHLPVQLEVNLQSRFLKALCQTENISESGMLLKGLRSYPPGTVFEFEIQLPGESVVIRGRAEVARNTDVEREKTSGFGARFLELDEAGLDRLESLLINVDETDGVN